MVDKEITQGRGFSAGFKSYPAGAVQTWSNPKMALSFGFTLFKLGISRSASEGFCERKNVS